MKTLQLDEKTALKLYPDAPEYFKTILEENFTKEFFNQDITERIKTLQDVYDYHGVKESDFNHLTPWLKSCNDLDLINLCLNEDWEADWENSSEDKWLPYHKFNKEKGWGFDYSYFNIVRSMAGSRLVFKNQKLSDYAGTTFIEVYRIFKTR